jgi:hypothetical protein
LNRDSDVIARGSHDPVDPPSRKNSTFLPPFTDQFGTVAFENGQLSS